MAPAADAREADAPPLRLVAYADGASRGNPGPASFGAVVLDVFAPPRDEYRKAGEGFGD